MDTKEKCAQELQTLCDEHGSLEPSIVVQWAQENPESALHTKFTWDDSIAAQKYRLWQARQLITEVEVIYPDGKKQQVYVSPVENRGNGGYVPLVAVMSDAEKRAKFLSQALTEYRRVGEKYADLQELAGIRDAVEAATINQQQPMPLKRKRGRPKKAVVAA